MTPLLDADPGGGWPEDEIGPASELRITPFGAALLELLGDPGLSAAIAALQERDEPSD